MSVDQLIRERVQAGVELLDEHEPRWRSRINPSKLDVASPSRCVLGQVFSGFSAGACELGLTSSDRDQMVEHGFEADLDYSRRLQFEALNEAWLEAIA